MKKLYGLTLLLLSFSLHSQNKDFKNLFKPVASICWDTEKAVVQELEAKGLLANSDSLIDLWEATCAPNEASIRTKILYDLKFKTKLETAVPNDLWRMYLEYLQHDGILSAPMERHRQWTQKVAEGLLQSREWDDYSKGVLSLLAGKTLQSTYNRFLKKDLHRAASLDSLSELIEREVERNGKTGWGIAYQYAYLSGTMADSFGAMHGLSTFGEYRFDKLSIGFELGFAFGERNPSFRFDNQGSLDTSDLGANFKLNAYLAYRLIRSRRHHWQVLFGIGYNSFSTDLSFLNDLEEREVINLADFTPNFGLDYRYQIYGSRSIGIRSQLYLNDYNNGLNNEFRGDLSGWMLLNSLYFRF